MSKKQSNVTRDYYGHDMDVEKSDESLTSEQVFSLINVIAVCLERLIAKVDKQDKRIDDLEKRVGLKGTK